MWLGKKYFFLLYVYVYVYILGKERDGERELERYIIRKLIMKNKYYIIINILWLYGCFYSWLIFIFLEDFFLYFFLDI